ncbi:MAG: hypothetical protein ACREJ2_06870 [Planctomycetota bacterium]
MKHFIQLAFISLMLTLGGMAFSDQAQPTTVGPAPAALVNSAAPDRTVNPTRTRAKDFSDADFKRADQPELGNKRGGDVVIVTASSVAVAVIVVILILVII